jgi:hypothetical protein
MGHYDNVPGVALVAEPIDERAGAPVHVVERFTTFGSGVDVHNTPSLYPCDPRTK